MIQTPITNRQDAVTEYLKTGRHHGRICNRSEITDDLLHTYKFKAHKHAQMNPQLKGMTDTDLFYHWVLTRDNPFGSLSDIALEQSRSYAEQVSNQMLLNTSIQQDMRASKRELEIKYAEQSLRRLKAMKKSALALQRSQHQSELNKIIDNTRKKHRLEAEASESKYNMQLNRLKTDLDLIQAQNLKETTVEQQVNERTKEMTLCSQNACLQQANYTALEVFQNENIDRLEQIQPANYNLSNLRKQIENTVKENIEHRISEEVEKRMLKLVDAYMVQEANHTTASAVECAIEEHICNTGDEPVIVNEISNDLQNTKSEKQEAIMFTQELHMNGYDTTRFPTYLKIDSSTPVEGHHDDNIIIYAAYIKNNQWVHLLVHNLLQIVKHSNVHRLVVVYSCAPTVYNFVHSEFADLLNTMLSTHVRFDLLFDEANRYYDFGKYSIGIRYLLDEGMETFNSCSFVNDSVVICQSLQTHWTYIHKHVSNTLQTVFGMVESNEQHRHLQSWWLTMGPRACAYWCANIQLVQEFRQTVQKNEIELGHTLVNMFKVVSLVASATNPFFDTSSNTYEVNFKQCTLPFIKVRAFLLEAVPESVLHTVEPFLLAKLKHKHLMISFVYHQSFAADINLHYFLKHAISERPDIDYTIVINGDRCCLPQRTFKYKNLRVIRRENTGFDFGGHHAALNDASKRGLKYDYHIFMNSGVMGPLLSERRLKELNGCHWSKIFLSKITERVKLVGTTIVCLPDTDLAGPGPCVEGFFFATDEVGLQTIRQKQHIFKNHQSKESAIIDGEYALSKCMFENGYTIDCMLEMYHDIDWTDSSNHHHNNHKHPSRKGTFYGQDIDPYQVIFHKWHWHNQPEVRTDVVKHVLGLT